jgi:hypothetical protein
VSIPTGLFAVSDKVGQTVSLSVSLEQIVHWLKTINVCDMLLLNVSDGNLWHIGLMFCVCHTSLKF